ncbi:unnamed protein product [Haemonchus placei]|uniref:Ion channel n=1 Tax=Haemonchus placei TaxID=6290 RepID=A0A158QNU2_HAEPC|nr:unnamed protein product [Haemonchus placei]
MHNLQQKSRFEKAKPFTLHCSLLLLVLVYAFAGGAIFNRLEAEALRRHQEDTRNEKIRCVLKVLYSRWRNVTANRIATCYEPERDERSEWSFVTATLYGFGIVTTLGYNRIAPITYAGRLFCIVYGICGIPITMIIIANVGQYLNNFASNSRRKLEAYRTQRRMSRASLSGKEYKESSIQVTSLALLIAFLIYVAMGALLLPALNGQIDFFNGLYFNFLCLTAIDFGQLVPTRVAFLPITFLYVCLGLAITTIAIDVGSEYMKKLHYLGKKMKDAASTKIWFGGKTLKVRDLLHAVGKKCGVEPGMIDALDLENVVERTIAMQGFTSVSVALIVSFYPLYLTPPSSVGSPYVFTRDIPMPRCPLIGEIVKKKLWSWKERSRYPVRSKRSCTVLDNWVLVPKKFKEKKEMYGRDPRKLFETYQEEWDRLERLSDKSSDAPKSILTLFPSFLLHKKQKSTSAAAGCSSARVVASSLLFSNH